MLTQCPACHTSFRITGDILRVAHGQVRCGRCNTQFDAIQHLVEEDELSTGEPPSVEEQSVGHSAEAPNEPSFDDSADADADAGMVVEEPLSEEITLEGRRIEISGVYRTLADEAHPHTQTIVQEFAADEDAGADDTPATPRSAPAADEPEEYADIDLDIRREPYATPPPIRARESLVEGPVYTAAPSRPISAIEFDDLGARRKEPSTPMLWTLWSVFGALALAVQLIHHYRQDLARRADVGPYIEQIYSALGLRLEPRWDLSAYAVKQWGVVSDPSVGAGSGTLRVRASIANHAEFPQPYPLLKLTLEDRFGEQVGSREFKPEEYLSSAAQAKRLLNVGESANADIAIVDPGEEAVGFHLNVCLQHPEGIECAG